MCIIIPAGGAGGYSHKWTLKVCAAQQGMVSDSENGIKSTLYIWKRSICYFSLTLEKGDFFPHSPSTLGANQGGGVLPCKARYIGMSSCHFITEPATGTSFLFLQ